MMDDCPACGGTGKMPDDDSIFKHYVEFTEQGWGIQHAYSCRADLTGCEVHRAMLKGKGHVPGLGWYEITVRPSGGLTFTRSKDH